MCYNIITLTWNDEGSRGEMGRSYREEKFVCCWLREKLFTGSTAPKWKLIGEVRTNQLYGWDWIG